MTKAQEIEALKSFIKSIPSDSYLAPWLESVLPIVESDINSDIIPFITPRDLREESVAAREKYKAELAALHAERELQTLNMAEESKRVIDAAIKRADEVERVAKQRLAGDIARLQAALASLS